MTGQAPDLQMLANQREVRLRMVEGRHETGHLPTRRTVTGLAPLLELALVRIHVTRTALGIGDSRVARLAICSSRVAFLAGHVLMQARQWEMCLRMVEAMRVDLGALPVRGRMALSAVGSKAPLVLVLVTRDATRRKTKPGLAEIFARQKRAPRFNYVRGLMAGTAAHARVFAVQYVACLRMIESLRRRVPVQQCEILAVVVRVALYAGRAGRPGLRIGRVQSLMLLKLRSNLLVALDASKRRCACRDRMALGAVIWTIQIVVRGREWARRYLSARRICCPAQKSPDAQKADKCAPRAERPCWIPTVASKNILHRHTCLHEYFFALLDDEPPAPSGCD